MEYKMPKMSLSDLKNLFSIVNSNQIVNIRDTKHAASKKNFAHPNKRLSKGELNHLKKMIKYEQYGQ